MSRLKDSLAAALPEPALGRLRQLRRSWRARRKGRRHPPLSWRLFGSLRRVEPIRSTFGWGAGQCIDRYYIERFLEEHSAAITGRVLEIGEATYTKRFGGSRVTRSDVLHVRGGNPEATIVADLTDAPEIPSDTFDTIILTQTLGHIFAVGKAVETVHRILRPGGVLLGTVSGIRSVSRYDMDRWGDYWRFTSATIDRLFRECFPGGEVLVKTYGNVLAASAFLHGLVSAELTRDELEHRDEDFELIVAVRATKAENGSRWPAG